MASRNGMTVGKRVGDALSETARRLAREPIGGGLVRASGDVARLVLLASQERAPSSWDDVLRHDRASGARRGDVGRVSCAAFASAREAAQRAADAGWDADRAFGALQASIGPRVSRRRRLGAYGTDAAIVCRVLDRALAPALRDDDPPRVVDPSCGAGRFVCAAATRAAARYGAEAAVASVRGFDVDPIACELARLSIGGALGCDVPADVIVCGDGLTLIGDGQWDVIVGNPPWASYAGRHRAAISESRLRAMLSRFGACSAWPCAHGFFLLAGVAGLAPGGRLGFVLPRQVCDQSRYARVRAAVTSSCMLSGAVIDLGEHAFEGVTQASCVVTLRRAGAARRGSADAWRVGAARGADDLERALSRLDALPRLPAEAFGDPGVHTGNMGRRLIVDAPAAGAAPIREGRQVRAFALDDATRWVRTDVSPGAGEYCRVRAADVYASAPILLRQTADRPIAARHRPPEMFRNSVLVCRGCAGVSDLVMTGLLNSSLFALLHRRGSGDARQARFPQVKVRHLRALPEVPESLRRGGSGARAFADRVRRIERVAGRGGDASALRSQLDAMTFEAYGLSASLAAKASDRL